jgi:hypothetical protein
LDLSGHTFEASFRSDIFASLTLVIVDMLSLDLSNPENSWVTIVVFGSVSTSELESRSSHWRPDDMDERSKVAAFFICYPYSEVSMLADLFRVHNEV